jgi:hypothetical protein
LSSTPTILSMSSSEMKKKSVATLELRTRIQEMRAKI